MTTSKGADAAATTTRPPGATGAPGGAAAGAAVAPSPPAARPGTLAVILVPVFMATLDFFIINVAIPSIQDDIAATAAQIEWVVAGFGLAYGVGLITGGRLGDLYGRRRMFALGLLLFTATSAMCGVAPNGGFLVTARVLQGVSAAVLSPQVLAILGTTYTGPARARAFNAYGMTMGLAAVLGQLVGGLLIHADLWNLDWRLCFLINVPIGLAALALTPAFVPQSSAPGRPQLDFLGMGIIGLALIALVLPLIEGREKGWPAWVWVSLALSVPLFAWFAVNQARRAAAGRTPLVDMSLFSERAFTVGLLAQNVFWMGQASYYLVFALYVQYGMGLTALQAGLIFIPIGVGYMATSTTAVHVAKRLGRQTIALGGLLRVVGLVLLLLAVHHIGVTGSVAWLIPGLIVDGAGQGLALAPLASTVLMRVKPQHAGAASGVLSTILQVGNAIGVAVIGIVFYRALGSPAPAHYSHAFNMSLVYLMVVGLALASLVQLLPKVTGEK
ncbi:MAG: MFS transporter [Frankiaceae bacterium]